METIIIPTNKGPQFCKKGKIKTSYSIFFLIINCLPSRSQSYNPLKGPRTPEICMNANGKWIKCGNDSS
jgi:hypothetical protein